MRVVWGGDKNPPATRLEKMFEMMARPVHFQSNLSNVGTPVVPLKFCACPAHTSGINGQHHAVVLVRLHPLVSKKSLDFNAVDSSQSRGS